MGDKEIDNLKRFSETHAYSMEGCSKLMDKTSHIDMSIEGSKTKAHAATTRRRKKGVIVVRKPVFTTTKQIARYITVSGIQSETSYQLRDWPKFAFKELLTNAWDFLNDFYPDSSYSKQHRSIKVIVMIDRIPKNEDLRLLRITVRNSNTDRHKVLQDLDLIFDFDNWQSTKRNQYRVTGGSLGDFLKRVLAMGYASWIDSITTTTAAADDDIVDKQWPEPLILRFNCQEYKVFIKVDGNISIETRIDGPGSSKAIAYTEVCATLPVFELKCILIDELEQYFNTFKIGKTGSTEFEFTVDEKEN